MKTIYLIRDPITSDVSRWLCFKVYDEEQKNVSEVPSGVPVYMEFNTLLEEAGNNTHVPIYFLEPEHAFDHIREHFPAFVGAMEVVCDKEDRDGKTYTVVPWPDK